MFDHETHRMLKEILAEVKWLRARLGPTSATLTIPTEGKMATINVGAFAQAVFKEFDGPNGTGNEVPVTGSVLYESDNTAVATVDPSGKITAVAAGTCNISGLDQGNKLSAQAQLTVATAGTPGAVAPVGTGTPGTAQSATLTINPA